MSLIIKNLKFFPKVWLTIKYHIITPGKYYLLLGLKPTVLHLNRNQSINYLQSPRAPLLYWLTTNGNYLANHQLLTLTYIYFTGNITQIDSLIFNTLQVWHLFSNIYHFLHVEQTSPNPHILHIDNNSIFFYNYLHLTSIIKLQKFYKFNIQNNFHLFQLSLF